MAPNTASKSGKKKTSAGARTIRVVKVRTFQVGAKKALGQRGKARPTGSATAGARRPAGPLADGQVGHVAGGATDADIEQQVGNLSTEDKRTFGQIRQLVAAHLGSAAAARLWLVTPEEGSTVTPAHAIRDGRGKQVLDALKAQWGRNPVYA